MPLTKEPLQMTIEQYNQEQILFAEALSKPLTQVPYLDTLLGKPVEGYEEIYWHSLINDSTETGIITSGAGVRIPTTVHIPTGDTRSYRKVWKQINGVKTSVWEIHQKDLSASHEPYGE